MHGSLLVSTTGLGVNVAPKVGSGGIVAVNGDVSVGTGVGEGCVAVGTAACVSAMIVDAANTAVTCKSTGLIVGVVF